MKAREALEDYNAFLSDFARQGVKLDSRALVRVQKVGAYLGAHVITETLEAAQ